MEEREILSVRGCDRLQFLKLLGPGPKAGWVSVVANGSQLMEPLPPPRPQEEDMSRWLEETRYQEVASVRLILAADCATVGEAVSASLQGRPCRIGPDACPGTGQLAWRDKGEQTGLPLPLPMSEQWREKAFATTDFSEATVWDGSVGNSSMSFSLGLRPLFDKELCEWDAAHHQLNITVFGKVSTNDWYKRNLKPRNYMTSRIEVWEQACAHPAKDFFLEVSSDLIREVVTAAVGVRGYRDLAERFQAQSVYCTCCLRPSGEGRTELLRQLWGGTAVIEASPGPRPAGRPDFDNDPVALMASQILYMLDIETRVWASIQGFPLVDIWRGIRRPFQWAVFSAMSSAASHIFALGSAADSTVEVSELETSLVDELEHILPGHRNATGKKQGQFTEGSVDVLSFAQLLDRVCRRADRTVDIFREFVDLGSGRGHAVLTAHALFPFRKCTGYEIDLEAREAGNIAARAYTQRGIVLHARSSSHPLKMFEASDFLRDLRWLSASLVFVNGVTWPNEMIVKVSKLALDLKPGAIIMLVARRFPADDLNVLEHFDVRGDACFLSFTDKKAVQVWVYQRRHTRSSSNPAD